MNKRITTSALVLAALAVGAADTAAAQDWTRTGPAGTVSRSWDAESGTRTVERYGDAGGTSSATATCTGGAVVGCQREFTATGPDGNTVSGTRSSALGPFRGRSATTITGPEGNTVTGFDRRLGYARTPRLRRW